MDLYKVTSDDIKCNLINLNQVVFEVTTACNFRCEYCIYSGMYEGFETLSNKFLPFNKAKLMLDYLIRIWNDNKRPVSSKPIFIGFYGGEPLLNFPLIKQIVQYVEEHIMNKWKVVVSMTTNAYLLDKHMDYLAEKDFQLMISLDGNQKSNIFRKTKSGEESFEVVLNNVQKLKSSYPSYFERRVNFNSVFNKYSSYEELYEFFMSTFNKVPSISQINNSTRSEEKNDKYGFLFKDKYESYFKSANRRNIDDQLFFSSPGVRLLCDFLFNHTDNVYSTYNELFIDKEKTKLVPTGTCIPFQKKMFITVEGLILQCEKISHQYAIGHVGDDGVLLDLEAIANNFNDFVGQFFNQCKECAVRNKCSLCMLQNYSTKTEGKLVCQKIYTEKKYKEYIKKNLTYLKESPELYEKILNNVIYY